MIKKTRCLAILSLTLGASAHAGIRSNGWNNSWTGTQDNLATAAPNRLRGLSTRALAH